MTRYCFDNERSSTSESAAPLSKTGFLEESLRIRYDTEINISASDNSSESLRWFPEQRPEDGGIPPPVPLALAEKLPVPKVHRALDPISIARNDAPVGNRSWKERYRESNYYELREKRDCCCPAVSRIAEDAATFALQPLAIALGIDMVTRNPRLSVTRTALRCYWKASRSTGKLALLGINKSLKLIRKAKSTGR